MSLKQNTLYEFGRYRVETGERRLWRGDQPLALSPKVFETLLALVENAGHVVEKRDLLLRIWPETFVEEGSLMQNVSVLRKLLDDEEAHYIETVPKLGYRFVAPVRCSPSAEATVIEEHTVTRVVTEIETTGSRLPVLPVALAGAAVLLGTLCATYLYTGGARPQMKSLAVLPLKTLPRNSDQRHLELGIADSIIRKASEISALTVRPIGAVTEYLGAVSDPVKTGRKLQVDAVLDGTLQISGDRVRVSVNLLDTSRGASIWTEAFDLPSTDLFSLEDEIAVQVVRQLRFRLDAAGQKLMTRHPTNNPEAYEHYLKGLYSNEGPHVSSRKDIEAAIARFQLAVKLDPQFPQAWAQLAICYGELLNFHESEPAMAEAARVAASRAYALNPDLPELRIFRAQMLWSWSSRYQVEEAIRELRRGIGPNDADVRSLLGVIYAHAGLERQAISELRRAIEIDPSNSLHLDRLAQAYVWVGRYEEARAGFERAFLTESENRGNLHVSAIPFLYAGQLQEARRRFEKARVRNPRNVMAPAGLALVDALEGRFAEAERAVPSNVDDVQKMREGHHALYAYAQIYALQGKSADALRWLRAAVDAGLPNYPMVARDPFLARIRSSREFVEFVTALKTRWEAISTEFR